MKVHIKNKVLLATLVGILVYSFPSTTVYAKEIFYEKEEITVATYDEMIDVLIKNGFTKETAEVLREDQITAVYEAITNGTVVDIYTCAMEIDNLAEVEALYSYSEEELISCGMSKSEIGSTKTELDKMYAMNDDDLKKEYGLSKLESKLFRRAIDNGKDNRKKNQKYGKELKNYVSASGSITTSEMNYVQAVTNLSSDVAPKYDVFLIYSWTKPYVLAPFNDRIVAAWGGGLNTINESGNASYYVPSTFFAEWEHYTGGKEMEVEITPNAGIEFVFPQSYGTGYNGNGCKTKCGSASFTLYQTKKQGYDTTVISRYCHRVISVQSADISFSTTGLAPSMSIGGAWDVCPQRRATISY